MSPVDSAALFWRQTGLRIFTLCPCLGLVWLEMGFGRTFPVVVVRVQCYSSSAIPLLQPETGLAVVWMGQWPDALCPLWCYRQVLGALPSDQY